MTASSREGVDESIDHWSIRPFRQVPGEPGHLTGHQAIAFVRNPGIGEKQHTRLTVVQGDILNADSVESAVDQCDVVLAAIAPKLKFRQKTQVFSKGVDNLLRALNQSRKRLLWVTSAGVDPEDLAATGFFFSKIFDPWHTPANGTEILRADLADFMLKQLADDSYLRMTPALAY